PERLRPAIFLAPALLFLGVTLVVPTIRTIYLSFRSRRGEELVGLRNYQSVFSDESIFSLKGIGNLFTCRLFVLGLVIAIVAVAIWTGRGVRTRRGVDMSAPVPVLSLTVAATLLLLAAVGALGGVVI